ncbi:MAG: hypothetical protein LBH17_01320 [Oscillospiraceae bacterium]|jgi:predicted nuclease with TOPRIM domain|nr:hypothetical protein [Oscillospiraceae bacterium]
MKDYARTFRTALFGFNRQDTTACIKALAAELEALRAELTDARAAAKKLTEENERLTALCHLDELEKIADKLRELEPRHSEIGLELRALLESAQIYEGADK